MNREDILSTAFDCVTGSRNETYGKPENSFKTIAEFWNTYLNTKDLIQPKDIAAMMALLKLARIAGEKPNNDNWVDLAGYAACGGEIEDYEQNKAKRVG